ncbi:MAG: cytochrome c [Gammaproteobacteria bacterium]|nr:cytochrome c [Gammaproteobacteria bacterium]
MHRMITMGFPLLLTASLAGAATPEDAIKYRQAVMMTMAGHVNAINLIFTGKVEHQDALVGHAEALAAAGAQVDRLFPAGSGVGKTDALALIWQEGERFTKATQAARSATSQLRDAVRSGDRATIGRSLKPVFDSCKGCHDRYQKSE